jgi:hypothetical protein
MKVIEQIQSGENQTLPNPQFNQNPVRVVPDFVPTTLLDLDTLALEKAIKSDLQ